MFSHGNTMVFGVIFSMLFISVFIYYINRLFNNQTKDILVRFILLIFASLVGVFIVDKVVAFGMPLLDDHQNQELFDLIKTLTLMIFSYYFGTQKTAKANDGAEN
jgi:ABC-type Co2+ transport system permease subunit